MAVAHSILVIAYHLIKSKEPYHDLGFGYFDKRNVQSTAKRLVHRLQELGYNINLDLLTTTAA
jgi:putative exporter of polyketide antibiotics